MRKFRVWEIKTQQYTKDLSNFWVTPDFKGYLWWDKDLGYIADDFPYDCFKLEQWTGLKDRDGSDVYKGDKVEVYLLAPCENSTPTYGTIEWINRDDNDTCAEFAIRVDYGYGDVFWNFDSVELKVIGNINEIS